MGLYCSKQLETTFYQFCEKPLHITFNRQASQLKAEKEACFHMWMSQRPVKEKKCYNVQFLCFDTVILTGGRARDFFKKCSSSHQRIPWQFLGTSVRIVSLALNLIADYSKWNERDL